MEVKTYICSKSVFGFSRMKPAPCTCHTYIMGKKAENEGCRRSNRKACKLYRSEKEERMKECRLGTHLAP